ncbi:MAG: hypothetical protein WC593_08055 [Methanoregula sp.]
MARWRLPMGTDAMADWQLQLWSSLIGLEMGNFNQSVYVVLVLMSLLITVIIQIVSEPVLSAKGLPASLLLRMY